LRIWIDLANSPHVPFFRALATEFVARGHEVEFTARHFAQTVELARAAGLGAATVGAGGGGRALARKAGGVFGRALALSAWARPRKFDLAVSHNSYSQIVAARLLAGGRSVTLMDYEHQPANHLAFRLASRVVVPAAFPEAALRRFGAPARRVRRYRGIKEDVYLADFEPDPAFADLLLTEFGVTREDVLVVARPPARDALYHRFENELFDQLIESMSAQPRVKIVLLARTDAQRESLLARHASSENVLVPGRALDGPNLVSRADLVVSAGGTMNREAAALGVPAASVYAGRWAAVDEYLVGEGRLQRIQTIQDVRALRAAKKPTTAPRRAANVRAEVTDLILKW
jgi:predicted glycosyltransferase